jgi:hypothetical protein
LRRANQVKNGEIESKTTGENVNNFLHNNVDNFSAFRMVRAK